jgi:arsenate reductase
MKQEWFSALSSSRAQETRMSDGVYNVLFLCNRNSARSLIAESVLNRDGDRRFRAFSAGSQPASKVHPMTLEVLAGHQYPTRGLRPKSWNEFATPDAPAMDFLFTVCDKAAGEVAPVWPGQPMSAHWAIPDPLALEGSDMDRKLAFLEALRYARTRLGLFKALPIKALDKASLSARLDEIAQG